MLRLESTALDLPPMSIVMLSLMSGAAPWSDMLSRRCRARRACPIVSNSVRSVDSLDGCENIHGNNGARTGLMVVKQEQMMGRWTSSMFQHPMMTVRRSAVVMPWMNCKARTMEMRQTLPDLLSARRGCVGETQTLTRTPGRKQSTGPSFVALGHATCATRSVARRR